MVNEPEEKAVRTHRRPQTWPTLLLGAVILLSGMALGVGGVLLFGPRREPAGPPPQGAAARIAARIADRCDLSDQQAADVRAAVERRLDELRAVGRDTAGRVDQIHQALCTDMKRILTSDQFEKWDASFDRVRRRVKQFHRPRDRHGPTHGHRPRSRGRFLSRFDRNNDGKLDADEVPPTLWNGLASADADGDGAVTPEELDALGDGPADRRQEEPDER
ncbi:MAG: hypothetical protein ACOC8E_00060 [Planctomycetota bacterium]